MGELNMPWDFGKPLSICLHLYVGIAQITITPPPPALKRAPWGTFFQARFSHFKGLYASGNGNTLKPHAMGT